jgi:hypothetical protein
MKIYHRADSANFANLPAEMKEYAQWECWRNVTDEKGKTRKVPIDPLTGRAYPSGELTSDEMGTATFAQAVQCFARDRSLAGIGFRFKSSDPFSGVDLDDCREPESEKVLSWAEDIVKEFGTYSEVSPSETGVKLIAIGRIPSAVTKTKASGDLPGTVEMYSEGRFFALTGRVLNGVDGIRPAQEQLTRWHNVLSAKKESDVPPPTATAEPGAKWKSGGEHYKELLSLIGSIHCKNISERAGVNAALAIDRETADEPYSVEKIREMVHGIWKKPEARPNAAAQVEEPKAYTPAELRAMVPDIVESIVFPFAVRGMFSLLDGQSKAAGKTTALLHAIRSMIREEFFLGKLTKQVKVLYVTEEYRRTFLVALARVGLADDDSGFLTIMPRDEWSKHQWPALSQILFERCQRENIGWLITDTFYTVAGFRNPDQENDASLVDAAAAPLRKIAGELDIPVTTTRHERKGGGTIGESGRGSTALTGAVDFIVRLQRLAGHPTTVRELEITGRIDFELLTAELLDGRYIVRTADTSNKSADEIKMVAEAIAEQPSASLRTIAKRTGVGRKRLHKVAQLAGWIMEESGWKPNGAEPK